MNDNSRLVLATPRMGRNCVLFEVENHGVAVRCSVSETAIQDASGSRNRRPGELLQHFTLLRERITAAALRKLRFNPLMAGVLHVWSGDLEDDPRPAVPAAALAVPS